MQLILPFVDLQIEYYDLSLPSRDATDDRITHDAAHAIQVCPSALPETWSFRIAVCMLQLLVVRGCAACSASVLAVQQMSVVMASCDLPPTGHKSEFQAFSDPWQEPGCLVTHCMCFCRNTVLASSVQQSRLTRHGWKSLASRRCGGALMAPYVTSSMALCSENPSWWRTSPDWCQAGSSPLLSAGQQYEQSLLMSPFGR